MLFYAISSLVLKSGFRSKDFLVQRPHRNYRSKTGRKSNEAKQMRFLYFTYNVVLLHRKWKKSIFHRKSTGRFLHGMPLNKYGFWFWFILPNAEFLHLSSVQWISVFRLATEQDAEFLHPIGIHYLLSVVFTYFYSFYQMQNFCISTQCSVLSSHWTRCRISASHL